jgi:serine/threonine protein kinase
MSLAFSAHSEPIPGYRLLALLGKGGFGEVWKCEAPGGLLKAIKLVPRDHHHLNSDAPDGADQEIRALGLMRTVRHPFLLSLERIEVLPDLLAIVMELADRSLHDQFLEYRAMGLPGIPRRDLLAYLREAAEVLDVLNQRHGLQHLDVKPRNLLLVDRHIKVADFGLVSHGPKVGQADRQTSRTISPLYAAPEVFHGRVSPASDQYSLAVAYQELLTGEPPFHGKTIPQLAARHCYSEPNLSWLPANDLPHVARALSKDPARRFDSCTEFVRALLQAPLSRLPFASDDIAFAVESCVTDDTPLPSETMDRLAGRGLLASTQVADLLAIDPPGTAKQFEPALTQRITGKPVGEDPRVEQILSEVIDSARGQWELHEYERFRYLLQPGQRLEHHFVARLIPGIGKVLFASLSRQWQVAGLPMRDKSLLYRVYAPGARATNGDEPESCLEVLVRGLAWTTLPPNQFEARVQVQPFGYSADEGAQLLRDMGPLVLANLRDALDAQPERRAEKRLSYGGTVSIYTSASTQQSPIIAQGRDLSRRGMGLFADSRPGGEDVRLLLASTNGNVAVSVPARIVRVRECPDGFDLGALFLVDGH